MFDNFKVCIIEDSKLKYNHIRNTLEELGIKSIKHFNNLYDANISIYSNQFNFSDYDVIILDMNFPMRPNEMPSKNMAQRFLHRMKLNNSDIPVIICSSENVENEDEIKLKYTNVIGSIVCDSSIYIKDKMSFMLEIAYNYNLRKD